MRVKGSPVCERGRGSRLGACLYVPSEQETQERGERKNRTRERQREGENRRKRTQNGEKEKEGGGEEKERIRETLERRSLARERRDRVPGGQDRFELSKIYGRRFDLRARGVTPGSLGQGP